MNLIFNKRTVLQNEMRTGETKISIKFRSLKKQSSDKIYRYISNLMDNNVSSDFIISKINTHYYSLFSDNNNFKEALSRLKNDGKLDVLLGINRSEHSDVVCNKIVDAYISRTNYLDLSNTNMNNVPSSIFKLSNLNSLDLSNNNLENIPHNLSNLKNLNFLNIKNNRLLNFPSGINALRNLEFAYLENNRFNYQEVVRGRDSLRNLSARIYTGVYEGNNNSQNSPTKLYDDYNTRTISANVNSLKKLAKNHFITKQWKNPSIWNQLDVEGNESFNIFLKKLWKTSDAEIFLTKKEGFLDTIINIFDKMERNSEYREMCLNISEESVESCGDRVAMGLIFMQLSQIEYPDKEPSLKELFDIEKKIVKANKILGIAGEKVSKLRGVIDEIETYVMYFKELKNELGINIDGMKYPSMSNVSRKDIEKAKLTISKISDNEIYEQLLDNQTICKKFRTQFDQIQCRSEFSTEQLIGENDGAYLKRMKYLSNKLKQSKINLLKSEICKM